MPLPSSGTISMSQMRTEFGYSGQVAMSTFYNNRYTCRDPRGYNLGSWYGYTHAPCCTAYGTYAYQTCGIYCLDADSMITMADGTFKRIADVVVGDVVESRDIQELPDESPNQEYLHVVMPTLSYQNATAQVVGTHQVQAPFYYNINNGLLLATDSHEHIAFSDGVWRIILSVNLRPGDLLLRADGTTEVITSVERVEEEKTFYTIDVEELDVYIANGIVTHNAKTTTTNPCNVYYWYHDGSCGYYYVDQGYNASACGCTPPVTCNYYMYGSYGFESYTRCDGTPIYQYQNYGDYACIDSSFPTSGNWIYQGTCSG